MSASQLLLISLGPIQDFIASARRCQDLWYGSWLLSDLARAAAKSLEGSGAATLIFPGALGNDKANVANKVLARVAGSAEDASRCAAQAEAAMRKRLEEAAQDAFAKIQQDKLFHAEVAKLQLADLIEFVWVSVPLDDAAGYAGARASAETLLASVKSSRSWGPVTWTDGRPGVPKSSLDGLRESVLDEALYERLARHELNVEKARRRFGVRGMERLCAVGLLKRLGAELDVPEAQRKRRPTFHSTSHLAAAPLLMAIERRPEARAAFEEYCSALRGKGLDLARFKISAGVTPKASFFNPFDEKEFEAARVFPHDLDGHLLFEERLEEAFEEAAPELDDNALKTSVEAAKKALRKALHTLGQPPKYYAILLADGDNMGAAIDALAHHGGLAAHQALSRALDGFASAAGELVARHGGSLIYSGGDDVLALLPLHGALDCARALHDEFEKAVESPLSELPTELRRPTLSVGVAVVHHLEPFGEARAWAKKAELAAKNYRARIEGVPHEKDALALVLVPRSGAETTIVDAWANEPEVALERWVQLLATEAISSKAAHDLLAAIEPLRVGQGAAQRKSLAPVVSSLARRILSAKRGRRGVAPIEDDFRDELESRFKDAADPFLEVERLGNELLVAQAFHEAAIAAFGAPDVKRHRGTDTPTGANTAAEVQP